MNKYDELKIRYDALISRPNIIDPDFYNGVVDRYCHPIITPDHVPLHWRYDLNPLSNPHFIERLGINATLNPGAIYHEGTYYLMVRVEGTDRKSFFALAQSNNGVDGFEFIETPVIWEDKVPEEVNAYDMRLVKHDDGYIYGIYCSESKDPDVPESNTSAAVARTAIVRTKDLKSFERLPNIKTNSNQQRNIVLHPEFVDGKYAFYTRPQDGFIDAGSGSGICFGLCDDIEKPIIDEETVLDKKVFHTVYELKNGQGPAPIRTEKGWIHIAHGVRNTAAGLRYVLYVFATALDDITKVIAKPSGHLIAPYKDERIGDVSNVLFCNGAVVDDENNVYIYYASSDTRIHVATTTLERLMDYTFNNPPECFRTLDCVKQRNELIANNTLYK